MLEWYWVHIKENWINLLKILIFKNFYLKSNGNFYRNCLFQSHKCHKCYHCPKWKTIFKEINLFNQKYWRQILIRQNLHFRCKKSNSMGHNSEGRILTPTSNNFCIFSMFLCKLLKKFLIQQQWGVVYIKNQKRNINVKISTEKYITPNGISISLIG